MAHTDKQFRCPFQIKGEKEGTIVEIHLTEEPETREQLIAAAFKYFHETPNTLALRFHLPESLKANCSSNEELKVMILPYQAEILAGELEYRLDPFLPYQMRKHTKEELKPVFKKELYKFATAHTLSELLKKLEFPLNNTADIASWVLSCMFGGVLEGKRNTHLFIADDEGNNLLTIAPGSIHFYPENYEEYTGPGKANRNCFGVVMSPFYPEAFGRYSDDIQIVMSRMKDFTALPSEQRRKIREKSNQIYRDHGVRIDDIEEDKQPEGVWIPDYVTTPV